MELNFGDAYMIVNPQSLIFHPVGKNLEWWYFRLNTLSFAEIGVYKKTKQDHAGEILNSDLPREVEWLMSYFGEEVLEIEAGK